MGLKRLSDQNVSTEYRGQHEAPCPESGCPIFDLSGEAQIYPDDVYGSDALRMYGDGNDRASRESLNVLHSVKDKPGAKVTIYRAFPKPEKIEETIQRLQRERTSYLRRNQAPQNPLRLTGSEWYNWAHDEEQRLKSLLESDDNPNPPPLSPSIKKGDWITLSRFYAEKHGIENLGNQFQILSATVRADQVFTDGNSLNEMGYWGKDLEFTLNGRLRKSKEPKI